ncbi:hypothetical protein ACIBQX_20075 [Nonomuraea sp. NPDC049714]
MMTRRGIDISRECPKPWTEEIVAITMGCGGACPAYPDLTHCHEHE